LIASTLKAFRRKAGSIEIAAIALGDDYVPQSPLEQSYTRDDGTNAAAQFAQPKSFD
jgi:hypothetical protein